MKKAMKVLSSLLAAVVLVTSFVMPVAFRASAADEYSVCGNFNNMSWDSSKAIVMKDSGNGIYTVTVKITNVSDDGYPCGFKVLVNKSWNHCYGPNGATSGKENVDLSAFKVGDYVTFKFDSKTHVPTADLATDEEIAALNTTSTTTDESSSTTTSNPNTGDAGTFIPAALVLVGASIFVTAKFAGKKAIN